MCWPRLDGLHGKQDRTHEPGAGMKPQAEPLPVISSLAASRPALEQISTTDIVCHKADIILMIATLTHGIRVTNEVSSQCRREIGLTNSWAITSEGDKRQPECLGTIGSTRY